MRLQVTFRHMDHTLALDKKIEDKCKKLGKYLDEDDVLEWVCWVEDTRQCAEVKVHHRKKDFMAHAHDDNLYHTLDKVVEKLEHQLAKSSEKWKDHRKKVPLKEVQTWGQ